jgi:hypothetical protein
MGTIRGRPDPLITAAALAGCLAVCALAVAALMLCPGETAGSVWKGYSTFLVDSSIPEPAVLDALRAAGYGEIISGSTQPVTISNWADSVTVDLSTALGRLIPGDPRRDPYLESLSRWFSASVDGKPFRAYYSLDLPLLSRRIPVASALAPFSGKTYLPDNPAFGGGSPWLNLALGTILLAAAAATARRYPSPGPARYRSFGLALALASPWILVSAGGSQAALVAILWGTALTRIAPRLELSLLEYSRTRNAARAFRSLALRGLPHPAPSAIAVGSLAIAPGMILPVCLALLASALVLPIAVGFMKARGSSRFVPVPLTRGSSDFDTSTAAIAVLALAAWGIARILGDGIPTIGEPTVYPAPIRVAGSAKPGPRQILANHAAPDTADLPGLGDWLVHMARVESLPLRRIGAESENPFMSIAIDPRSGKSPAMEFDEAWAARTYAKIPSASIEGMLAAQGGATAGALLSERDRTGTRLASIDMLLYILLLIAPIGRIVAGIIVLRSPFQKKLRQEA